MPSHAHNIILLVINVVAFFLAGRFLKSLNVFPECTEQKLFCQQTENNALQLSVYLLFLTQMNADKLPH